jgi:hypothetical protein
LKAAACFLLIISIYYAIQRVAFFPGCSSGGRFHDGRSIRVLLKNDVSEIGKAMMLAGSGISFPKKPRMACIYVLTKYK